MIYQRLTHFIARTMTAVLLYMQCVRRPVDPAQQYQPTFPWALAAGTGSARAYYGADHGHCPRCRGEAGWARRGFKCGKNAVSVGTSRASLPCLAVHTASLCRINDSLCLHITVLRRSGPTGTRGNSVLTTKSCTIPGSA